MIFFGSYLSSESELPPPLTLGSQRELGFKEISSECMISDLGRMQMLKWVNALKGKKWSLKNLCVIKNKIEGDYEFLLRQCQENSLQDEKKFEGCKKDFEKLQSAVWTAIEQRKKVLFQVSFGMEGIKITIR